MRLPTRQPPPPPPQRAVDKRFPCRCRALPLPDAFPGGPTPEPRDTCIEDSVMIIAGMMISKAFAALVSYGVISIAITLFNKAVLSTYEFPYAKTLTLVQSIVTLLFLHLLRRGGVVTFEDFDVNVAKKVFPLAAIFLFYVVISLSALGAVNIPMFTALRRTTILLVLLGEYLALSRLPSRSTVIATVIMTVGAIIAAVKDLTYDPVSYMLVALTNISTAGYTVAIARVKKTTNLSVFGLLYYNTLITLPFLAAMVVTSSEFDAVQNYPYLFDPTFLFLFFSSAIMAFFLNITTFFATALNSPLAVTVTGQLKNFFAFLLGLVLFDDYIYDPVNMLGLVIGFVGGVLYAHWSYQESATAKSVPAITEGSKAILVGSDKRDSSV